jgi:xylan 1,4-beta-xylosidase
MRIYELARKYGVTAEGAGTWAFEFEDQPAFAGFRELSTNGIDKPVLNVFRLFGMLGRGGRTEWLAAKSTGAVPLADVVANSVTTTADVNATATLITWDKGRDVNVLLWNYHDADVPSPPAEIHLTIDGLRSKTATAAEFRVDETHSNAWRAWQQMGSPAHPTPDQTQQLEKTGALEQTVPTHPLNVKNGKAEIDLTLPRQGVALVRLRER